MQRAAWSAIVHGVAKSRTQLGTTKQELFSFTRANFEHVYCPLCPIRLKSMTQKEPFTGIKYLFIHGAMS